MVNLGALGYGHDKGFDRGFSQLCFAGEEPSEFNVNRKGVRSKARQGLPWSSTGSQSMHQLISFFQARFKRSSDLH